MTTFGKKCLEIKFVDSMQDSKDFFIFYLSNKYNQASFTRIKKSSQ